MPVTASVEGAEVLDLGPLKLERRGDVLVVGLDRQAKRNAINDATIEALDEVFSSIPDDVRAEPDDATKAVFALLGYPGYRSGPPRLAPPIPAAGQRTKSGTRCPPSQREIFAPRMPASK